MVIRIEKNQQQSIDCISYSKSDKYIGIALSSITGSLWNGQISIVNSNTPQSSSLDYNTHSGNTCLKWLSDDSIIFSSDNGKISLLKLDETSEQLLNYISNFNNSNNNSNNNNNNDSNNNDVNSKSNNNNKPIPPKRRRDNIIETLFNNSHDNIITSIDLMNDRLVSSSLDRTVNLWDINNRSKTMSYRVHTTAVNNVQFSKTNDQTFASASTGRIVISDCRSKATYSSLQISKLTGGKVQDDIPVRSLCWDNANNLWCGLDNGDLISIDLRSSGNNNISSHSLYKQHHTSVINEIKFNTFNSKQLSTVSDDHTLQILDIETGKLIKTIKETTCIKSIDWNKSVENQFILGTSNGSILIDFI